MPKVVSVVGLNPHGKLAVDDYRNLSNGFEGRFTVAELLDIGSLAALASDRLHGSEREAKKARYEAIFDKAMTELASRGAFRALVHSSDKRTEGVRRIRRVRQPKRERVYLPPRR